jgi:hypothetical protein
VKAGLKMAAAFALAGLATTAGCSHGRSSGPLLGGGAPQAETRDELLVATGDAVWRGDLATAHAMLTRLADRERGVPDSALDFWSEVLALLRCEPLARVPRGSVRDRPLSDPWDALRRLAQIERVRLTREAHPQAASVIGERLKTGLGEKRMVWPVERELWTDELPMPVVVSRCAALEPTQAAAAAPAPSPTETPADGKPQAVASSATIDGAAAAPSRIPPATEPEVALVASSAELLPAEHPARPLLFIQAAVLSVARGQAQAAAAPLARLERLPDARLTPAERERVVLAAALATVADPAAKPDALLAKGRAALALKVSPPARRALSLLLAERLMAAGRMDDAAAVLGPPPHGDDVIGRYITFKQMEMHARAGRRGPLLAEAREVLGRRGHAAVEDDPTSLAIMDIALRTLLSSPVSDETLEVLESLGPPRERLGRAEAFAQAALEAGAFRSAMATFLWLYEADNDPNRQLQNLARASVAAARAGDRAEFARTFRQLAGQEDQGDAVDKQGAKKKPERAKTPDNTDPRENADKANKLDRPKDGALIASAERDRAREKRRAARSVNWQRALLVVARDALPALVENDDQPNLATLVETLKRHLGDAGRGPVDEELTTLYRAASAHLKSGARAYAETVGADRRPILLGDVLIGRKYEVPAPRVDLSSAIDEVGTLLFVPRRGNDASTTSIERWPGRLGVAWNGSRS